MQFDKELARVQRPILPGLEAAHHALLEVLGFHSALDRLVAFVHVQKDVDQLRLESLAVERRVRHFRGTVMQYVGDQVESCDLLVQRRLKQRQRLDNALNDLFSRVRMLNAVDHRLLDLLSFRRQFT